MTLADISRTRHAGSARPASTATSALSSQTHRSPASPTPETSTPESGRGPPSEPSVRAPHRARRSGRRRSRHPGPVRHSRPRPPAAHAECRLPRCSAVERSPTVSPARLPIEPSEAPPRDTSTCSDHGPLDLSTCDRNSFGWDTPPRLRAPVARSTTHWSDDHLGNGRCMTRSSLTSAASGRAHRRGARWIFVKRQSSSPKPGRWHRLGAVHRPSTMDRSPALHEAPENLDRSDRTRGQAEGGRRG